MSEQKHATRFWPDVPDEFYDNLPPAAKKLEAMIARKTVNQDDGEEWDRNLHQVALYLIDQNAELLDALQFLMVASGEKLTTAFEQAQEAIAKATKGQE